MKNSRLTRAVYGVLCILFVAGSIGAQQVLSEKAPPQLIANAPAMGTFFLLGRIPSPPYPFDPYFGTLPVYAYDGVFFVDDSQVSFSEQSLGFSGEGGGMMLMSSPAPCDPCPTNGGGVGTSFTGPPAYSYEQTNVWLEINGVTNGQAFFTVRTPDSFEMFDMFSTTNLTTNVAGLNLTNWLWLTRTLSGQTNLTLTNLGRARAGSNSARCWTAMRTDCRTRSRFW